MPIVFHDEDPCLMWSCKSVTLPRLSPGGIGHGNPAVAGNNCGGSGGGGGGTDGGGDAVTAVASGSPVRMGGGVDCDRVSKPGKSERHTILFIALVAHFASSKLSLGYITSLLLVRQSFTENTCVQISGKSGTFELPTMTSMSWQCETDRQVQNTT